MAAGWQCYIDESYNSSVFCTGGLIGPKSLWDRVTKMWDERITYEKRRSEKKGLPGITRYHATDCANLKKEFAPKHGWTIPRQILLTKRLCKIMSETGPIAIVVGARTEDLRRFIGPSEDLKLMLYDLCFRMTLMNVADVMREYYGSNAADVIFDQSEEFGAHAERSFETFLDPNTSSKAWGCFAQCAPGNSRTCTPLQAADFIAYEAMRLTDGVRKGEAEVRKSLQALLGAKVNVFVEQFTEQNFSDMVRMIENRQAGREPTEGVTSKLKHLIKHPV